MTYDTIIRNGRWFDGTGAPSAVRNIGIAGGRIATVTPHPLDETGCGQVIDATVMPPKITERTGHVVGTGADPVFFDFNGAPVMGLDIGLAEISLAVASRFAQSLNVFSLAQPIKAVVAISMLITLMPKINREVTSYIQDMLNRFGG